MISVLELMFASSVWFPTCGLNGQLAQIKISFLKKMASKRLAIAVARGDGIGPEIMNVSDIDPGDA
jgi:hypothetical protein